jgi:ferredoxin--NADP+ reductase
MTEAETATLRGQHYNATMIWMREANPDLRVLRIRPDFPLPRHLPGQYTTLGLGNWEARAPGCQEESLAGDDKPKLIRRAYSISSSILDDSGEFLPHDIADWLEFYIVLVRDSGKPEAPALTPRLFTLGKGDRLFLGEKITGHFTAEGVRPDDAVVFLSTGTGEAPHNYLSWELLRKGHRGRIVSVCCVRYLQDLAYLDTHRVLMERFTGYHYLPLTTRDPGVKKKVYIQELITSGQLEERLGDTLDPSRAHVFLCGNPNMIGVPTVDRQTGARTYPKTLGVIEILEKRGFTIDQPAKKIHGNIHFEEYW